MSQPSRNMSCNFSKQPFRKYFQNSFKNILKTFYEIFRHLKHFPKTLSKGFRKLSCIFLGKVSKIFQEIFLNVYCTDIWTFQKLFSEIFLPGFQPYMKPFKNLAKIFRAMWVHIWRAFPYSPHNGPKQPFFHNKISQRRNNRFLIFFFFSNVGNEL